MLHSIYDLTTFSRKTTGDVPAKLVGASTTVIGAKLYLFGGRLVSERRMVSDLYSFDPATYRWERVPFHPEDDAPTPRYFHSADSWCGQLVVFGGMSTQPESPNPDELCVLNDVRFFDLATGRWAPPSPEDPLAPRARYAHLSSVSNSRLFVIGGQDFYNTWLDDVCVYDLVRRRWVLRRDYPHHCGTYRSIAVSSETCVRFPSEEKHDGELGSFATPEDRLIHMSYSAPPTDDYPCDIYLYSNYNFTNVKRELEVFSPLPGNDFVVNDRSADMSVSGQPHGSSSSLPPGLRFPTGALLGNHLIVCGTYLAHSYQSFSIWALDLQPEKSHPNNHPAHPSHHRSNSRTSAPMRWTRIDPGRAVETGSWFRSALWTSRSQLFVFGNRNGNLVDDYNRRLLSWEHVAVVDLEAFGIYAPPGHADAPPTMYKSPSSEPRVFDIPAQVMGLSVLEQGLLTDFEIVCSDGRRIAVSRRVLEERWPWFHNEMARTRSQGRALADKNADVTEVSLPPLPGSTVINNLDESVDGAPSNANGTKGHERPDPRLTPRSMVLPEQYPVSLAFVQYLYARALITPLQHAPAVLSQLLVLATTYNMDHLRALVKHAMHGALTNTTSVGVYEVATLCNCRSLQIRALKTVMAYTTKKGSRSKSDKSRPQGPDGHGGGVYGGPDASHGPGGSGGYGGGLIRTRPRGTSDAMWRTVGEGGGQHSQVRPQGYEMRGMVGREEDYRRADQYDEDPMDDEDGVGSLPLFVPRPRHERVMSVVSLNTENEMRSITEMLNTIGFGAREPLHDDRSAFDMYPDEDSVPDPQVAPKQPTYADDIFPTSEEIVASAGEVLPGSSFEVFSPDSEYGPIVTHRQGPLRPSQIARGYHSATSSGDYSSSSSPVRSRSSSMSSSVYASPRELSPSIPGQDYRYAQDVPRAGARAPRLLEPLSWKQANASLPVSSMHSRGASDDFLSLEDIIDPNDLFSRVPFHRPSLASSSGHSSENGTASEYGVGFGTPQLMSSSVSLASTNRSSRSYAPVTPVSAMVSLGNVPEHYDSEDEAYLDPQMQYNYGVKRPPVTTYLPVADSRRPDMYGDAPDQLPLNPGWGSPVSKPSHVDGKGRTNESVLRRDHQNSQGTIPFPSPSGPSSKPTEAPLSSASLVSSASTRNASSPIPNPSSSVPFPMSPYHKSTSSSFSLTRQGGIGGLFGLSKVVSPSVATFRDRRESELPMSKEIKGVEKRRKKEEAKARTAWLAEEMARKRKEKKASSDNKSLKSNERKIPKDPVSLYGDMAGLV